MRRGAKPAKAKVEAKDPVVCKSSKNDDSRVIDLEKSLEEALKLQAEAQEQQAATSEILRVISSSPMDVQPTFDAIAAAAATLCAAQNAGVFLFDGTLIHLAAHHHWTAEDLDAMRRTFPRPPGRGSITARAILTRAVVHVHDITQDPEYDASAILKAGVSRATLSVPMLRDGQPIGAITVARREAVPFTDAQVALLETFARQAVIAIENVRLFTELETRNAELREALDHQTATAEVLAIISRSPTDVQPVFAAIARSAAGLCEAELSAVYRYDGELIHVVANTLLSAEQRDAFARLYPMPPGRGTPVARAVLERRTQHVPDTSDDPEYLALLASTGFRSALAVPMVREGAPIGAIAVGRMQVREFTGAQIQLLETFADQAVIAIENVRLFNETKEALERQTATSDILRVISSSPTDVEPVFAAIAESAARLCEAFDAAIFRRDGDSLRLVAHHGPIPIRSTLPLIHGTSNGRAVLEGRTVHVSDMQKETEEFPEGSENARRMGHRTILSVPLMRKEGVAIGTIILRRTEARLFTDRQVALLQTFADQAVIAIENVRLFTELGERNRELTTALDQQTVTADILRVISSSPTDLQPVMEAVVQSAARLCGASDAQILRPEGDMLRLIAAVGSSAIPPLRPLTRGHVVGRAILDRRTIHVLDMREELADYPDTSAMAYGVRTHLATPLLRESVAIGVIRLSRTEVRAFTDQQIELLKTFADQAVIAIENVRLFKELQERNRDLTVALEQQTATSEILKVISRSPTDVQPVFDAIVRSAVRLCDATFCNLIRLDGELLHQVAQHNFRPEALQMVTRRYPAQLTRQLVNGRAILDRAIAHIPDVENDPEYDLSVARAIGFRSVLGVPMFREGSPIGAIAVGRAEPGPFSPKQIELLQTFADQAVIAIENVRLFTELQMRNRDLTEALDRQTATAEVLRVISQSQTNVQPVFDTIARSAAVLCGAAFSVVFRLENDVIDFVAHHSFTSEGLAIMRRLFPAKARERAAGLVALQRTILNMSDIETDPRATPTGILEVGRALGYRSVLIVPMHREGTVLGALSVVRSAPGLFSDRHIELLQTFADQAAIAIENARLLSELQARTSDLTRSVDELTALGEVGRALGSTLDLDTVLQTIVSRASQLAGTDTCSVFEYDEAAKVFRLRASSYADPRETETLDPIGRATPIPLGQGVVSRAAALRQPVQVPDIAVEGAYESPIRGPLLQAGYRAILTVPLLLEEQVIGALGVSRKTPGDFSPEIVRLLTTFATQSALAIQNAHLFRELADKSGQLEVASRHKSEFLANMSHELRTPLNAIIGFSEVLAEGMFGDVNEKQTEYLRDILESGQHLLSLINDILDLSKIEAGRMELEPTDFDLAQAIDNALTLIRERAQRRGIALHRALDERLGRIRGDERKIKQVLLNLLSNALKFTAEGGRIDVRAGIVDGLAEISVTDTGVGIAPEDQDAVFEEFRQVGTAAKKVEGTGLGLALSRKFIELHGGRIWVKSQLGSGSTFTFTLPLTIDQRRRAGG